MMSDTEILEDHLQKKNPRSLYRLCPKELHKSMRDVPRVLFLEDEVSLEKTIHPTSTMRLLRYKFWDEYMRIQHDNTIEKLDINAICRGICNPAFFKETVFKSRHVTAWMMTPPKSYEDAMEETLILGVGRLRELMAIPLYKIKTIIDKKTGKEIEEKELDHRAANLILKAYYLADQRAKGGFVQRTANLHANLERNTNIKPAMESMSMKQIEERLKQLSDGRVDDSVELPITIEATASEKVKENVDKF